MKAIGGYFELEDKGKGIFPHDNGLLLNTGRNALEHILRSISNIRRIYLPYYTCEVVLEPIKKLSIPYTFYHINENLEIIDNISLKDGEYIIANNYFGIKDTHISNLQKIYGDRLIIDCAQAFFSKFSENTNVFYSTRKFVGVPDGGIALCSNKANYEMYDIDDSNDRLEHLYIRKEKGAEAGFKFYQKNECKLDNQKIMRMSSFTNDHLHNIDYDLIIKKRIDNFKYIHTHLKNCNLLNIDEFSNFTCPMVYPYFTTNNSLKQRLIENKIFVATYWSNVFEWCKPEDIEYKLANNIIAIPIDQRYGIEDMERIINLIKI